MTKAEPLDFHLHGTKLRELRQAAGLRQGEVARQAGISASYLNLIEHDRRKVTLNLLERLAKPLGLAIETITSPSTYDLLSNRLEELAQSDAQFMPLVQTTADLSLRFPQWAELFLFLAEQNLKLRETLSQISDRLSHDPQLFLTLHEVISALSSVRSVAEILANTADLSPAEVQKFHQNLHDDSLRLSQRTQSLVTWLDPGTEDKAPRPLNAKDEFQAWLQHGGWEHAHPNASLAHFEHAHARQRAENWRSTLETLYAVLPTAQLHQKLRDNGANLFSLLKDFNLSPVALLKRLASEILFDAAFLSLDGTGAIVMAKENASFSLPKFGSPCPLWPLFPPKVAVGALRHAKISFHDEAPLDVFYAAEIISPESGNGPETFEAAMLILKADWCAPLVPVINITGPTKSAQTTVPTFIRAGISCQFCPIHGCEARRSPALQIFSSR